ncbi:MAG: hypothetical protein JRI23_32930 [Deltaproteobacteria bacterium]|nr:hypothetical protein [Deltaproteobacteria bacterium]MBW2537058.1 hypothetical protein [Deltaproteobacteria bacterium]
MRWSLPAVALLSAYNALLGVDQAYPVGDPGVGGGSSSGSGGTAGTAGTAGSTGTGTAGSGGTSGSGSPTGQGGEVTGTGGTGGTSAGGSGAGGICGQDFSPPGGTCPDECTGGCDNGTCTISCNSVGVCENLTLTCPAGFACHVRCFNGDSCRGAQIHCPDDYPCTVLCAWNNSCTAATIHASAEGTFALQQQRPSAGDELRRLLRLLELLTQPPSLRSGSATRALLPNVDGRLGQRRAPWVDWSHFAHPFPTSSSGKGLSPPAQRSGAPARARNPRVGRSRARAREKASHCGI